MWLYLILMNVIQETAVKEDKESDKETAKGDKKKKTPKKEAKEAKVRNENWKGNFFEGVFSLLPKIVLNHTRFWFW